MTIPLDRHALADRVAAGQAFDYLPFYGHSGQGAGPWVLSQWWPAAFTFDGLRYPTAEHWMMAEKARTFGDERALAEILLVEDPQSAKVLGRAVEPYDDAVWSARRGDAVVKGNLAKFTQHPALGAWLVATGDRILVEASPTDKVWGVGLGITDPAVRDPRKWRGANLLGFALMRVRDELRRR